MFKFGRKKKDATREAEPEEEIGPDPFLETAPEEQNQSENQSEKPSKRALIGGYL